jgi:disulfide bond formation protein DsbB
MTIPLYEKRLNRHSFNWRIFLCWGFAGIALILSSLQEYLGKIEPCQLCKWQRLPFVVLFFIAPVGFTNIYAKTVQKIVKGCLLLSFALGCFHLLIQTGLIADTCSVPQTINSMQDFENMLALSPSCSKISWSILSIPLSAYNATFSLLFWYFSRK